MGVVTSLNWRATETSGIAGQSHDLLVTGAVQVSRSNLVPKLTKAVPPGLNPEILILELTVDEVGDVGTDALIWKPVLYYAQIEPRQYASIDVRDQTTFAVDFTPSLAKKQNA